MPPAEPTCRPARLTSYVPAFPGSAMMVVRIFGAICALLAVFLFGMWLTWPELPYNPSGFPIDRRFLALSLNGEPLMLRDAPNIATLEVRGHLTFRHRV